MEMMTRRMATEVMRPSYFVNVVGVAVAAAAAGVVVSVSLDEFVPQ